MESRDLNEQESKIEKNLIEKMFQECSRRAKDQGEKENI
jgi:hypothetical protein